MPPALLPAPDADRVVVHVVNALHDHRAGKPVEPQVYRALLTIDAFPGIDLPDRIESRLNRIAVKQGSQEVVFEKAS